jgi:PAP2 superfamily
MLKWFIIFYVMLSGTSTVGQTNILFSSKDYITALKRVTDVMVNDVTSPVAASRYYAYVTLAANEVQHIFNPATFSFNGLLKEFNGVATDTFLVKQSDVSLTTVYSVLKMGQLLLPSGYLLQSTIDAVLKEALKKGITKEKIARSKMLADTLVQQIVRYSQTDGFRNLSGYAKYKPHNGNQYWQPTEPAFMAAVEPNWNRVRTFLLDSAQQIKPVAPTVFDTTAGTSFYKQLYEVYNGCNHLNKEQKAIAMFWDCNPFALQQIGHVEFGLKKISPGGHWMGITGIACLKRKINLQQTVFIHTIIAITMADAFIACWDEKYRSNRVRPETVINKWINPRWKPLLQTPPFPEYPSGHSVISTAAAVGLTKFFGNNFSFTDDTEKEFGLPARKFKSFLQASKEAAISRLYGGIHYRDAIENGQKQGADIGNWIMKKINFKL